MDEQPQAPAELTWQAAEYTHHAKGASWYLLLIGAAAVLGVILVLMRQWLSLAVVVSMTAALGVYGNRQPHDLTYSLSDKGVSVGPKFFPYHEFRSFSLDPDPERPAFELDPNRRFMPRLTILLDAEHAAVVAQILEAHLPREEHAPDWVDRWTHKLKF